MTRHTWHSVQHDTKLSVISHQPTRHPEFISGSIDTQMLKQVQHDRGGKSRVAFALAEVLITLTIIGVIAALTIPNLIAKYEKQQTITGLKKMYNILQQATQLSIRENGPISDWDFSLNYKDFAEKYYTPYLKITKAETDNKYLPYKTLKNGGTYYIFKPIWILDDGSFINFKWSYGIQYLIVDINGYKGPNKIGRDLFAFTFLTVANKLVTYVQYEGDINGNQSIYKSLYSKEISTLANTMGGCNANATGGWALGPGSYCSRRIELEGWQITDDYPW